MSAKARVELAKGERRSSGSNAGLRQPLPWPSGRTFKILSIDGGGIRGIFPAALLADIERRLGGVSAGEYFDLIAGTSTGGIIALGLGLEIPAARILQLYMEFGPDIFPRYRGPFSNCVLKLNKLRQIAHYKYMRGPLEISLGGVFGDRILGESTRRLCIPAFDGNYNEVHIFKTPHHPDFKKDWTEEIIDVALATAAAPTYFSVFRNKGRQFADGGVWANNPIMIALVDALTANKVDRRSVQILSISCGEVDEPFSEAQLKSGGLWHWRSIMTAAMKLQSQNATGQAGLLIGRDQLIRLAPSDYGARIEMDDFALASAVLPGEAVDILEKNWEFVQSFFDLKADQSPAFYGPRSGEF